MKRFLLFFSSFVIATGFAAWAYFSFSANHTALQQAFIGGGKYPRQIAAVNAVEFEKAHIRAIFGSAKGQYLLGRYFKTGEVGTADPAKSFYWVSRASDQGYASATLMLARFYFTGYSVTQDDAKGVELVEKAAMQESSEAKGLLGIIYIGGIGVEQDFEKAKAWLAQSDEPEAQALFFKLQAFDNQLATLPEDQRVKLQEANRADAKAGIGAAFRQMIEKEEK